MQPLGYFGLDRSHGFWHNKWLIMIGWWVVMISSRCGALIPVVVMLLGVATAVQADLMPIPDDGTTEQIAVCMRAEISATVDPIPSLSLAEESISDGILLIQEAEKGGVTPSFRPLVDRSNSVDLCLYALVGLGVFRSGHWVKRSSWGVIPDWYHSGAPQQIGHSRVVGPDAHCLATACFVQPDCAVDNSPLCDGLVVMVSLGHLSQCTLRALVSRGPPAFTGESVCV
jgi:hypothetical protein